MNKVNIDFKQYYDLYDTKIKVMGDLIEVFEYSDPIKVLKDGKSEPFKKRKSYLKQDKGTGEIRADSLNRSFSRLMDLAMTNHNEFKTFITLTFAENVTDLDYANKCFNNFTTIVRKINPNFKYLGVPEFQKRGAVHYHLMTNLDPNSEIIELQKNNTNMYDVKYWKHGFTSVFDLKLANNDFSVSLYMAKYFWKDIDNRLFGRRKILSSRNLRNPDILRVDSKEIEKIDKYIKHKQLEKQKTVINANDYGPRKITISRYK